MELTITSNRSIVLLPSQLGGRAVLAGFCYSCTLEESENTEFAIRNDFAYDIKEPLVWQLCEGCGSHLFNKEGKRYCSAKSWYEDQENMNLFDCPYCHNFVALLDFFFDIRAT